MVKAGGRHAGRPGVGRHPGCSAGGLCAATGDIVVEHSAVRRRAHLSCRRFLNRLLGAGARGCLFSIRVRRARAGGRLRIVLRLHPPELAVLPWKLLFSEHYGGYLCRRSSMVRYVDAPEPVRPLTVTPLLRVLGMTALPGDLAALDADTEQRRL